MNFLRQFGLVFLVAASAGIACVGQIPLTATNYLSPENPEYSDLVLKGFDFLDRGNFQSAAESFRVALNAPRAEVPNYEATLALAYSQCKLGEQIKFRESIDSFTCMLEVDEGKRRCPSVEVALQNPGNFAGDTQCFNVMCGEMFQDYYETPTERQKQKMESLRRDLEGVLASCGRADRE